MRRRSDAFDISRGGLSPRGERIAADIAAVNALGPNAGNQQLQNLLLFFEILTRRQSNCCSTEARDPSLRKRHEQ